MLFVTPMRAVKELPENECRYGVFDVEYTDPKTGGQRNKIVFFQWYVAGASKTRKHMNFYTAKHVKLLLSSSFSIPCTLVLHLQVPRFPTVS